MKNANLLKVYKDHSFLIFDLDDGSTVKYDFATKRAFGKTGNPVMDLKTQLRGIRITDVYDACVDPQYAKFLKFVQAAYSNRYQSICNIGTILSHVPNYSRFEQIFSAGVDRVNSDLGDYNYKPIPPGVLKLCRLHELRLTESLITYYAIMPDVFNLAFSLEYVSLNHDDVISALCNYKSIRVQGQRGYFDYHYEKLNYAQVLLQEFGYQPKALLLYLDRLKTFEAMSDFNKVIHELYDYARMMHEIGAKFDRYPRHFLTTHAIASRNYNRINQQFDESSFALRVKPDMECNIGNYTFIYPKSTQDIKNEAIQQNNCVSSYIKGVLEGQHDIIFMRKKDNPDKSLVTCEVRNNKIVQALQSYNDPLSHDQEIAVEKWNRWYSTKKQEEENARSH